MRISGPIRNQVLALVGYALLLSLNIPPTFAQGTRKLQFEVASIKPKRPQTSLGSRHRRTGDRVIWLGAPLITLIEYSYDVNSYEIVGDLPQKAYDIEATVPTGTTEADVKKMFQRLLEDRFALKVRRDTRDMPVYVLVVAPKGHRLKLTEDGSKVLVGGRPIPAGGVGDSFELDGMHFFGQNASIAQLASALSDVVRRPVVDRTGLIGHFDFNVPHGSEDISANGATLPNIRTAIQEVLGLKLQDSKGPVQMLVIDHIENRSEN